MNSSVAAPARVAPEGVRICRVIVLDHVVQYPNGRPVEASIGIWRCQHDGCGYEVETTFLPWEKQELRFCPRCGGEHRTVSVEPYEVAAGGVR